MAGKVQRFYKCLVVSPYGVRTIYSCRDKEALEQFIQENYFSYDSPKGFKVHMYETVHRIEKWEHPLDEYRTEIESHTWC